MAIVRLDAAADPLAATTDWTKLLAHVAALFLSQNGSIINVSDPEILKGSVFQIGGAIYYASSDTTISGGEPYTAYVKITASGASATAAYVADLSGVTWNDTYNGWYDGDGALYVFDEGAAVLAEEILAPKRKIVTYDASGNVSIPGALTVAAIYSNGQVSADSVAATGAVSSGGVNRGPISSGSNAVGTKSADFTVDTLDIGELFAYMVDTVSGTVTVTMPSTASSQYEVTVLYSDSGAFLTWIHLYRVYAATNTFTLPTSGDYLFSVLIKRIA